MRVIISSAGRRVYLVQWFQHALAELQLAGDVYVLDHDPNAASAAAADGYRWMPAYTSPDYTAAFWQAIDELQPDLFISLNDYELTKLSQGLGAQLRARGVAVPTLDHQPHQIVADKLQMTRSLLTAGIPTPTTVSLCDTEAVYELVDSCPAVIIKDRWGSGSSGLRRFTRDQAHAWWQTYGTALTEDEADSLVLQPDLGGSEYGLDIVTPVHGGPVEGIFGRRKLLMRHGETAAASTVDSAPFHGLATQLNAVLGIRGTVDVDVMHNTAGIPQVIDINPRFGGGYPFSHIAGADVPHFLVASTAGRTAKPGWNTYRHDYIGAKHEGIIGFDAGHTIAGLSKAQPVLRQVG